MPLPSQLPKDLNKSTPSGSSHVVGNRYSVIRKIGSGNFGTAFLISDSEVEAENERFKVLKQICVGPLDPGETVDAMHEANLLHRLTHQNIVQFHDSFIDGQFFCLVLEYCEGGDLECRIKDFKKKQEMIPEDQVIKWLHQLLDAIMYMHGRRILHRDLKSRNVFLKDNRVKIGDFGISRILVGASDKASTFVGTPYYMSPEVLKHEQYDAKCDVWSLGCVLYEICCLEHAFEGRTLMEVMFKIVSDHTPQLPQTYSRGLNNLLESMLDRDAVKRPTAKQLLQRPLFKKSNRSNPLGARERLKMKRQREVDARIQKLKQLNKTKVVENEKIRQESKEKNFLRSSLDANMQVHEPRRRAAELPVINDIDEELEGTVVFQPLEETLKESHGEADRKEVNMVSSFHGGDSTDELLQSLMDEGLIPEDEDLADTYYSFHDDFEASSSSDELPDDHVSLNNSEYRDMVGLMEDALYLEDSTILHRPLDMLSRGGATVDVIRSNNDGRDVIKRPLTSVPRSETALNKFNNSVVDHRMTNIRKRCIDALGGEVFEQAYDIIKGVRFDNPSLVNENAARMRELARVVPDTNQCMELEQLIYLEQQRGPS
ncbi:unnamed protein product [Clavelina lepadiformis]|uniref:non-specific serine/threonine protein kinase n=1 Tax=Clavelina lepadiformis TaxID=159417 RepID=A0ABP0FC70_CLALP